MPLDHIADLKRHVPTPDDKAVEAIIKHLGIALKSRDASMVSCSSPSELERVRESWLKKKLGLTGSDEELDKSIREVCEMMKGDHDKSRVAFYYLLAQKHGKLAGL